MSGMWSTMLSGWVSAARMTSSLVPRLMLHLSSVPSSYHDRRRPSTYDLVASFWTRVSQCSDRNYGNGKTYSALLELAVVAGLLHTVEQLLDQRGVLSLGPSGGLVLSGHCVVGRSRVKMTVWSRLSCHQGSLRLLALGCADCRGECDRRTTDGDNVQCAKLKAASVLQQTLGGQDGQNSVTSNVDPIAGG
jgi:hypothetical protein